MKIRHIHAVIAILACAVFLPAQQAHYANHGSALLPDPTVTPGASAMTNESTICTTKWGKDERHVTAKMKEAVYASTARLPAKGFVRRRRTPARAGSLSKRVVKWTTS